MPGLRKALFHISTGPTAATDVSIDRSKEDAENGAAIVKAYEDGRAAAGREPCDERGKAILGGQAKAYLEHPYRDPRVIALLAEDPDGEARRRRNRFSAAERAAYYAGTKGWRPSLRNWIAWTAERDDRDSGKARR